MTITYIQRDTTRAVAWISDGTERAFELTTDTEAQLLRTVIQGSSSFAFVFTTPSNEPNSSAWPTGTFDIGIDINAIEADLTVDQFGLNRVNSTAGSSLEEETESVSFSSTGLHSVTTASFNWTAGSAGDRLSMTVRVDNTNLHMDQDITLDVNTSDTFVTGPWGGDLAVTAAATAIGIPDLQNQANLSIAGTVTTIPNLQNEVRMSLATTALGVATVLANKVVQVAVAATAIGVAAVEILKACFVRATAVGVPGLRNQANLLMKGTATANPTVNTLAQLIVRATAVGLAGVNNLIQLIVKTTSSGIATVVDNPIFAVLVQATVSGVASVKNQIQLIIKTTAVGTADLTNRILLLIKTAAIGVAGVTVNLVGGADVIAQARSVMRFVYSRIFGRVN